MNFDVIPTPDFERAFKALAKRHKSLKKDILDFSQSLQDEQGNILETGLHMPLQKQVLDDIMKDR